MLGGWGLFRLPETFRSWKFHFDLFSVQCENPLQISRINFMIDLFSQSAEWIFDLSWQKTKIELSGTEMLGKSKYSLVTQHIRKSAPPLEFNCSKSQNSKNLRLRYQISLYSDQLTDSVPKPAVWHFRFDLTHWLVAEKNPDTDPFEQCQHPNWNLANT